MRVLTQEEYRMVARAAAAIPGDSHVIQMKDHNSMVSAGYIVAHDVSSAAGQRYHVAATPRGKLAVRCHEAWLKSCSGLGG